MQQSFFCFFEISFASFLQQQLLHAYTCAVGVAEKQNNNKRENNMEPNAFKKNKFLQKYTYLNTKTRIANIVSNIQSYALIITKLSLFN